MLLKSVLVWLCIAAAETAHGILRVRLLNRRVGDHRARQIAVFTGSALILTIAWLTAPWLRVGSAAEAMGVGALWTALMLTFEIAFGRMYLGVPWARILSDFDLRKGGLLGFGMVVLFFAPLLAARWRGLL